MAVNGVSSTSSTSSTDNSNPTTASQNSVANLTSNDFLKLLITQLQNQDPTQPVGNEELLNQLSAMRALQSNVELSTTLNNLANNQAISSGAAFLGKIVTGTNANQKPVTGIADSVFLQNGTLQIGVGSDSIPVSSVTGVALDPQAAQTSG